MLQVPMRFARATKNFLRYEASAQNSPVEVLYIAKSAFTGQPASIDLTVKEVKGKA